MQGLGILLMTVVLYSCGVGAQLTWDTPREASKTDSVRENVAGGSTIYILYVNDADGTVTYSIKSQVPPIPAFTIDGTDLKLPADGVDAETDQTFVFRFTASDGSYTVDSVEFTVTVTDVDESPPVFDPPTYSGTVDDGAPAGTPILTVTASDADVNSSPLQYYFAGGNALNHFSIDSNGGIVVRSTGTIDLATTPSYSLSIFVSSGDKGATAMVTITVNGAASPPEFLDVPYKTSICRNVYKGTAVEIFDFTVHGSDSLSLEANFANSNEANFKMVFDGTSNVISLKQVLDVQGNSYDLELTATEETETTSETVTINIWDPPVFNTPMDNDDTKICENTGPGEDILQLTTTSSTGSVTFSVVDSDLFEVADGMLKTKSTISTNQFDIEPPTSASREYSIKLKVVDSNKCDAEITFIIKIEDDNDNGPVFSQGPSLAIDVEAGTSPDDVLTEISATDADVDAPNNVLTYTLTGDGVEDFEFDSQRFELSVASELSYTDQALYELTLTATDGGTPAKSAMISVNIQITTTTVDECAVGPCKNGATCVPALNIYGCHCVDGWTGRECQTNIDDCILNPCSNDGLCSDLVDSFTCNCSEGWTGDTCTLECTGSTYGRNCGKLCGCVTSNLEDNTSDQFCNRTNGACNCNSKWQGHTCNEDVDECLSTTICDNKTNQACENYDGYYECVCQQGFSDNDKNICTKVPSVIVTATNPTVIVTVKDNLDIILGVGLGVGIPILLIAIIGVVVCCRLLKKREHQDKERQNSANEVNAKISPPVDQLPRFTDSSLKQGSVVTRSNRREQYQLTDQSSNIYNHCYASIDDHHMYDILHENHL